MNIDLSRIKPVKFNWDKHNIEKNWKKHKVTYKESEQVFFNKPHIITYDEKHSRIEKKFRILGQTNRQRRLFISFTIRNQKIRIISARNQNKKERKIYAQKKT